MKQKKIAIILVVLASLLFIFLLDSFNNKHESAKTSENNVRVALITDPLVGNNQFIMQAYNELLALTEEYKLDSHHLEATNTYTWTEGTRKLCELGYNLIIGLGWQATASFTNLATDYPDINFAVIDTAGNGDNIRGVVFDVHDSCYTLGVMLANAFPDENIFGYIGNFKDAGNFAYESAFRRGVLSVNPKAKIATEFASTYSDPFLVRKVAELLVNKNVKVIMASVSSSANDGVYSLALEKAKEGNPIYTTGLSVDQTSVANPYIIGGVTKDTALATRILIEDYINENYVSSDISLGLAGNGFNVIHLNGKEANYRNKEIITDKVLEASQATLDGIANGSIIIEKDTFMK